MAENHLIRSSRERYAVHRSKVGGLMSALGHKRTFRNVWPMSALPPKADMGHDGWDVCFVPIADISVGETWRQGP
jgi:hypothetical protein